MWPAPEPKGTIWVRGAVLTPGFLEPAPQLSEARRRGEKTPRELAAPTAPRTWCNAEPRKTTPGRETTGIPGSRKIAHPEARVESVGETREATGSCGRAGWGNVSDRATWARKAWRTIVESMTADQAQNLLTSDEELSWLRTVAQQLLEPTASTRPLTRDESSIA